MRKLRNGTVDFTNVKVSHCGQWHNYDVIF